MRRLTTLVIALFVVGCARDHRPDAAPRADNARVTTSAGSVARDSADTNTYPVVRGLYLNRFAVQSPKKMQHLFAIADSSELNAFVMDMKDEFGLNYRSSNPQFRRRSEERR